MMVIGQLLGILFVLALWAAPIGLTLYGIFGAFHVHVVFGLISLIPPCGLVNGVGLVFGLDIAQALMNWLVLNGAQF